MRLVTRRSFLAASVGGAALATIGSPSHARAQGTTRVDRFWLPITGDWNGDRKDGIGAVDTKKMMFYLRNSLSKGETEVPPFRHGNPKRLTSFVYEFGDSACVPIVGDWDGDGKDGIGIVYLDTMTFHLRNALSEGPVDYPPFRHGGAGYIPIVGDWDGDGKDGIGVVDPKTMMFYLRNSLSEGESEIAPFRHGNATGTCVPIVGDWDGDRKDGIGIVYLDKMEFHLRNSLSEGKVDYPPFHHGNATGNCVPIAGDWDGDGKDGIGIVYLDTMMFYLRDPLSEGPPSYTPFPHGGTNSKSFRRPQPFRGESSSGRAGG